LANLAVLLVLLLSTPLAFAAGDYVWEAKFAKELPKAEQGNVKSQYAIGEMYEKGKGTEADINKAFKWYLEAANQGDKKAAYKVGLFYYKGQGVTKSYRIARTWLTKSADKKYVRAEYYLGEIYENGRGVSRNNSTALKWYKRALAGGYGTAAEGIKRVASAQAASKNVKSSKKPRRDSSPTIKVKKKTKPIKTVLKGGWKKRKRPVEYLPSSVNDCKRTGKNLECQSDLLKRNIGMADINYTTKAIIFGFKSDGRFKVSYRNNVKSINVTDEEFAESGESVPVKLGWQDAEHKLACQIESSKKIICTKNKTRKITLTR
ncbi:MAG: sel1 repeat family protein, partial [Gammaproteobacteria bacterium]|nr:sel1 repeat family protein [Gammaproteobacteria bacterium]